MDTDLPNRFDTRLRSHSKRSVGWTLLRFLSDQFFSFAVFVVLARILSPHEIGAFAIIAFTAEAFRILSTAGLVQTIARADRLTPEFLDTVHRGQQGLALLSAVSICLLAGPIARSMDSPSIAGPLMAMSLVLPLATLGTTHMALRLREFGHRTTALRSVVSGLLGGGAAVAAALAGWGVWALVVQRLVAEAAGVVLSRRSYHWKPGWRFDWPILRGNLMLNASLIYVQLAFLATTRIQEMAIGAGLGLAAVGVYRTAWRVVELIGRGAIQPFTQVAMQTLSRVRNDRAELARAYQWMIARAAALSFPALVGFGTLAPMIVPFVFGPKWAEAGELAQIFAFMAFPFTLNFFASPSLSALGAGRSLIGLSTVQLAASGLLTLAALPFGLFAVAWSYVARAYLTVPLQMLLLRRASGIGPATTMEAIWAPLAASTVMGMLLFAGRAALAGRVTDIALLAFLIPAGGAVYAVTLFLLSPQWRAMAANAGRSLRKAKA